MKNLILILGSVLLNSFAQLLIKHGMSKVGDVTAGLSSLVSSIPEMITNIFLVGAVLCYIFSLLLWMMVLQKVEVSVAYPFLSLGYVFVLIFSFFIFHEHITPLRIVGILTISLGVFIISRG